MFPKNTFALRSGGREPAKAQKTKKQDPFQRVRDIISYLCGKMNLPLLELSEF